MSVDLAFFPLLFRFLVPLECSLCLSVGRTVEPTLADASFLARMWKVGVMPRCLLRPSLQRARKVASPKDGSIVLLLSFKVWCFCVSHSGFHGSFPMHVFV